jgi:hypothetical protein
MNNKIGLSAVLESKDSLLVIALSLRTQAFRTRALVLEMFGAVCLIPGGHEVVLDAMDEMSGVVGFRFRFEVVMYSLWQACQGVSPAEKDLQVCWVFNVCVGCCHVVYQCGCMWGPGDQYRVSDAYAV